MLLQNLQKETILICMGTLHPAPSSPRMDEEPQTRLLIQTEVATSKPTIPIQICNPT